MRFFQRLVPYVASLSILIASAIVRAETPPDPLRLIPEQADLFFKIERPRQLGQAEARGNRGVEQPGAVEVGSDPGGTRGSANRHRIGLREHAAAAEIMRVLDDDEACRRQDDVARRFEGGAEVLGREQPALADRREQHAGIARLAVAREVFLQRLDDDLREADGPLAGLGFRPVTMRPCPTTQFAGRKSTSSPSS